MPDKNFNETDNIDNNTPNEQALPPSNNPYRAVTKNIGPSQNPKKKSKKILIILLAFFSFIILISIIIFFSLMACLKGPSKPKIYQANIEPKSSQTGGFCGYKQSDDKKKLLNSKGKTVVKAKNEIKICGDDFFLIDGRLFDGNFKQLTDDSITVDDPPYYLSFVFVVRNKTNGWFTFKDNSSNKLGVIDKTAKIILAVDAKDPKDKVSLGFNENIDYMDDEKYGVFSWELMGDSIGSAIINLATGKKVYDITYPYQTDKNFKLEQKVEIASNEYQDKQVFSIANLQKDNKDAQNPTAEYKEQARLIIMNDQVAFRAERPTIFSVVSSYDKILKIEEYGQTNNPKTLIRSYYYDLINKTETTWDPLK